MSQTHQNAPTPPNEDEIDLRELVGTLLDYKYAIATITAAVTALGLLYAFVLATPVYEARAVAQMGYYMDGTSKRAFLKASEVAPEVELLLEIDREPDQPRTAWLERIGQLERTAYLEIVARSHTPGGAREQIGEVVQMVRAMEREQLDLAKEVRLEELQEMREEAATIRVQIAAIESALERARAAEPALVALFTVEQQNRERRLLSLERDQNKLERRIAAMEAFHPAAPIADWIQDSQSPVAPKKKLIVAVSLVAGGMLAIFGVFFWEFARSFSRYRQGR